MLGGPNSGLTARISTPCDAAAFAARPILAGIDTVVFGLMTWIRIFRLSKGRRGARGAGFARPRQGSGRWETVTHPTASPPRKRGPSELPDICSKRDPIERPVADVLD